MKIRIFIPDEDKNMTFTIPTGFLFSRVGMSTWQESGSLTFEDRVRAHYEQLLQNPVRHQLDDTTANALEAAFKKAVSDVCAK